MVNKIFHQYKSAALAFIILSVGFLLAAFAADFDNDGLPDHYQFAHGYATNGFAYSNMVLWIQMDEANQTNIVDRSLHAFSGIVNNYAGHAPGLFSNSLNFAVNTAVTFPATNNVFNLGERFTISVWFQGTNSTQPTTLSSWSDASANSWVLGIETNSVAQLRFISDGSATQTVASAIGLNVRDSQWHHLVGVYESSNQTAQIYVDGGLEISVTVSNWNPSAAQTFYLGDSQNPPFKLDETRLYNIALNSNQILQLPVTYSDIDGDNLSTFDEYQLGTNPNNPDTDGDGVLDATDPYPLAAIPSNGLTIWLKADAGVATNNAYQVSQWVDQSGKTNTASQANSALQPLWTENVINGKPVLRFDGVNDTLRIPYSASYDQISGISVFYVVKPNGPLMALGRDNLSNGARVWKTGVNNSKYFYEFFGGGNGGYVETTSAALGSTALIEFTYANGNNRSFYVNGNLVHSASVSGSLTQSSGVDFSISGRSDNAEFFNGDIAEVLVYNRALSESERLAVESYLDQKYRLITTSPPSAPSGLTASVVSSSQVNLSWNNTSSPITSLKIERKTGANGTYQEIASVSGSVSYYLDTNLTAGTSYSYRVRAVNNLGTSDDSNEASISTPTGRSPVPIAGMKLWLRADGGVSKDAANAVNAWSDVSGNGNQATQNTAGTQPLWVDGALGGKPAIRFDGANDTLTIPAAANLITGTNPFTAFYVHTRRNGEMFNLLAWTVPAADNNVQIILDGGVLGIWGHGSWIFRNNHETNINEPHVAGFIRNGNTWQTFIDGAQKGSDVTDSRSLLTPTSPYYIGRIGGGPVQFLNGDIAEVILYDRALSASERAAVESYLNYKYSIALPPDAAPTDLVATPISPSQVQLNWTDSSSNESSFSIERKTGASGTYTLIASVGANTATYTDSGLQTNTEYFYRVRAVNIFGNSDYSNEASATTLNTIPVAPSNLVANGISSSEVSLSWNDNSNNESSFKIERKQGYDGTYVQVAVVGEGVTTYVDSSLSPRKDYYYRVRASNNGGDSAYSNVAEAKTLDAIPNAPSNLVATTISSSQIKLSWTDNSTNEKDFAIERKTGAAGTYVQIAIANANSTSFVDKSVTLNTSYTYRIRAVNSAGSSSYSNEASATTSNTIPAAPNALSARGTSSQINLSWVDCSSNETGFKIERQDGSTGTFKQIAVTGPSVTTFSDTSVVSGTRYYYRIRATNSIGDSAYSNTASAVLIKDTDNDGMPDSWELRNLLNPLLAMDADMDPDGDGYTNLEEYYLGSDPQKARAADTNGDVNFKFFTPLE